MNIRNLLKKAAPEGLREQYRKIRDAIIKAEFKIFSLFPVDKNKVVFMNVWGYGDNPRWIAEEYERQLLNASDSGEKPDNIYFVTGKLPKQPHKIVKQPRSDADRQRKERKNAEIPLYSNIHFLKNNSVRANFALATARVWVDCNRKEPYITKRKGQCYIQTWHGSLPLKKIEGDCRETLSAEYLENARRDTDMTDIYISDSEFCNEIYRRAFGFKGKIFCFGSARLDPVLKPDERRIRNTKQAVLGRLSRDTLLDIMTCVMKNEDSPSDRAVTEEAEKNATLTAAEKNSGTADTDTEVMDGTAYIWYSDRKIARILAAHTDVKICLYAPTYREDDALARQKASENSLSIVEALEEKFGGRFVVVTRMHPLAQSRVSQQDSVYLNFEDDEKVVVNGNDFDDIYELMEAAEVLITDYSNTLFEFAYAKKPVFLYAPDRREYVGSRGVYFDYESLPYPVAENKNLLRKNIVTYDKNKYGKSQQEFFDSLSLTENGNAAEKQAKLIRRILDRS